MSRHLVLCGLRTVEHGKIRGNRKEVKMTHGFRKFFRTQLALAKVEYEVRKALVGHSPKDLDLVYTKYTEDQLFAEYKKAIPFLRIDQTVKLKKKVEEQQKTSMKSSR